MLVEFRHVSWLDDEHRDETLRFLEELGATNVIVDAPRIEGAKNVVPTVLALTSPTAYVRFHGRNAETWNKRGGSASERFDYLYSEEELEEWVAPLRELAGRPSRPTRSSTTTPRARTVAAGAWRRPPRTQAAAALAPGGERPRERRREELMDVLAVIHGEKVRAGVFGDAVARAGHRLEEWSLAWGTSPPRPLDAYGAVLVFGGAMHAGPGGHHPWLSEENLFMQRLLDLHKPVLGICLGAQLLAKAAHAHVGPRRSRRSAGTASS
jgi:hypothetical protein